MIGCLVLGDEIAYILDRDQRIKNVLIVDTTEGRILWDKLSALPVGTKALLMSEEELKSTAVSGYSVIVRILPASLHDDPKTMMATLAAEIDRLERFCDSIFMFYGLCRNTKAEIERFINRYEMPITFLTDEDGAVVDDCFGAILGGRKRYLDMISNNKSTMFITTGYAEHWAMKQASKGIEKVMLQIENYQVLFKALGYNKVMMLDNGLGDREGFRHRTDVFASIFGFGIEYARCDMTLFEQSYDLAMRKIPALAISFSEEGEMAFSRTLP